MGKSKWANVGIVLAVAVGAMSPAMADTLEHKVHLPVVRNGSIRGPVEGDALRASSLLLSSLVHTHEWLECMDAREWVSGVLLPYPIGDVVASIACKIAGSDYAYFEQGSISLYWGMAQQEGDWRNDWITWIPEHVQDDAMLVGAWLATGDW